MIGCDWKLMEFLEDGRLELYNLRTDLSEKNNLATTQPTKARELHAQLVAWRNEIKAPMPAKNDGARPAEVAKKKGGWKKRAENK